MGGGCKQQFPSRDVMDVLGADVVPGTTKTNHRCPRRKVGERRLSVDEVSANNGNLENRVRRAVEPTGFEVNDREMSS